jgi:hypothetical protein
VLEHGVHIMVSSLRMPDMADESRTTGMGLWTDANEMLAAAKHLAYAKGFEVSQPLYYLLGHALELSLKCYVRAMLAVVRPPIAKVNPANRANRNLGLPRNVLTTVAGRPAAISASSTPPRSCPTPVRRRHRGARANGS